MECCGDTYPKLDFLEKKATYVSDKLHFKCQKRLVLTYIIYQRRQT